MLENAVKSTHFRTQKFPRKCCQDVTLWEAEEIIKTYMKKIQYVQRIFEKGLKASSVVCFWLSLQMLSLTSVKFDIIAVQDDPFSKATATKMFVSHFSCRHSWETSKELDVNRCWRNFKENRMQGSLCTRARGTLNKLIMRVRRRRVEFCAYFVDI